MRSGLRSRLAGLCLGRSGASARFLAADFLIEGFLASDFAGFFFASLGGMIVIVPCVRDLWFAGGKL